MGLNDSGEEFKAFALLANDIWTGKLDELFDLVKLAREAFLGLPERERRIMSMRFGLGEFIGKQYTLEEVAEKEDITRERVRQIEQKTLARMRHSRNNQSGD